MALKAKSSDTVDLSKIKAILEMPPPKNKKAIKGFLGRL